MRGFFTSSSVIGGGVYDTDERYSTLHIAHVGMRCHGGKVTPWHPCVRSNMRGGAHRIEH
jgi:hypothetical protein